MEQNFLAPGPTQTEFNTLSSTVSGLSDQIANKIVVEEKFTTTNIPTFSANSGASVDINIEKSGYTPLGIICITGNGTNGLALQEYYVSSSTTVRVYFRNVTSSAITPTKIITRIIYMKS